MKKDDAIKNLLEETSTIYFDDVDHSYPYYCSTLTPKTFSTSRDEFSNKQMVAKIRREMRKGTHIEYIKTIK